MNKMKTLVAFAALMLCGGAWAATPVAVWEGDFKNTTKGSYTLTANGNKVADDGSTITINQNIGVKITGGNTYTVIVKARNYQPSFSDKTQVVVALFGGSYEEFVGFGARSDRKTYAVWLNSHLVNGGLWTSTNPVFAQDNDTHLYAITYSYTASSQAAQGTKMYVNGEVAYYNNGLRGNALSQCSGAVIGGPNVSSNTKQLYPASDMIIEGIAIFGNDATEAEIKAYKFPSDDIAMTATISNGDVTQDISALTWVDGEGNTVAYDKTAKLAIKGNGKVSTTSETIPTGSLWVEKGVELVYTTASSAVHHGNGTVTFSGVLPADNVGLGVWKGTVKVSNFNYSQNGEKKIQNWGNANSTVCLNGTSGYFTHYNTGSNSGNAFLGTIELEDFDQSTYAWKQNNGGSSALQTIGALSGSGTWYGESNKPTQTTNVGNSPNFEGSLKLDNESTIRFGNEAYADDKRGYIFVQSGYKAGMGGTWTSRHGIKIDGEVIAKGGTLGSDVVFGNDATIDMRAGNDKAISIAANKTLTLGDTINLIGATEGAVVLKGVATEPQGLALTDVTVGGESVQGAHLYYENNAIKYSTRVATTWEPRDSAITDGIFDWTATGAWTDLSGNAATWPSDQATASALDINLDTTKIKGIKVTGQVYVGNLAVSGTLGAKESFQFYNHLLEEGVDNDHEVNPDGEDHDCLRTKSVNLTKLSGGLGLKVPITGNIAFGEETDLTFVTGPADGDPSTAYAYEFVNRGGSIKVSGEGKFNVPNSMYNLPFLVNRGATIVYTESATVSGAISGEGNVIVKGSGTTTFAAENTVSGGITVETGTLKSGSNSAFGTGTITVANGAALDFAGFVSNATGYTVVCNGGTLKATGLIYANQNCIKSLTLGGNTTISGSGRIGTTMADASATTINLGSYTLTINGGAYLNLRNTTINGTGTIDISNGTLLPWGNASTANDVTLNLGANGHAEMNVGLTVKNFSMASGATFSGTNNDAITVTEKLSGTGSIPKLTLGNGATIDTTGNITVSNMLTFGNSLKVTGNVNDVIIKGSPFTGTLPSVTRVDADGNEVAETRTLVNVGGAIMFGTAYVGETISASELNEKGDAVIISGDMAINLDKDIEGSRYIAATQNATVTIKPSGKKTFISAADVKKLSFSSNITVNYVWNVPTKIININFGSSSSGEMSGDTTDKTFGGENIPRNAWNGYSANSETSANVSTGWNCAKSQTFTIDRMTIGYSGRGGNHNVGSKINPYAPFMWGYIDDNVNSDVQVTLSGIPFDRYDVIVYFQGDTAEHFFSTPQIVKGDTTTVYSYDSEMNVVVGAVANNFHWGHSLQSNISYEKNVFRIPNQTGDIKVQPQRFANNNGQRRATIAAIQIVASPAAMIVDNGVTTYYPTVVEALEAATDKTNVIVLDGSTTLPDGYSSYAVGDDGVVVAADAKIGEKGYATLQQAIDAAGDANLNQITILDPTTAVPQKYRVKDGTVMTAAAYYAHWTSADNAAAIVDLKTTASFHNADFAVFYPETDTESDSFNGDQTGTPPFGGLGNLNKPWNIFASKINGGNNNAYIAPGVALRVIPDVAAAWMDATFAPLSFAGIIVEPGSNVYGFKSWNTGRDRGTELGAANATTYSFIGENFSIYRANQGLTIKGTHIIEVATGKTFHVNDATVDAHDYTADSYKAVVESEACLKLVGSGVFSVGKLDVTASGAKLDIASCSKNNAIAPIAGMVVVDSNTTLVLPADMVEGDTFKVATAISGTPGTIKLGEADVPSGVTASISGGTISLVAQVSYTVTINGETTGYPTIEAAIEAASAANGAVITLADPSAAAPAGFTKLDGGVLKACDYVVISPNAYVSDWQAYVTARQAMPAAEGLVLGVKNAAEIYDAYPYASANVNGDPRNAAESIHKWIGIMQKLGTKYFVLGGPWKDARNISESDKDTVIPGITAYPIKPSASSIMNDRPSDLYYACHFLANDQKYVWDPSGDGVYVGFHETNPDVMTDPRHFQPTCVVSRMAFWPGFDKTSKTYADLIAAYKDKLVRGEAYDFAGNGYYLTWVDRAIAYRDDGMPDAYDVMADRLHAIVNQRTANELLQIAVTKNLTAEELASKKVPLLTRNWEIAMPFGHGTPEGAAGLYGSDYVSNTGLTKFFMANVPCFTGYLGAGDATLAHCALSNPNGGALVSINNTGYGYTTEIGLTKRYIGVSEEMLDYTLDAYVAGATAGEAWRTAISDFAGNVLDPATMAAKLEARGYDGTDATYKIDNKYFVYAAIVEEELFGDPLVAINERDVYAKDNDFATFRISKDSETEVAAANLRPTDRIAFDKTIFTTGANAIKLDNTNLSGHRLYFVPSEVGNKAVWTTASDVVANQQILVGKNTTLQLKDGTVLQNGSIISGEGVVTVSGERTVSINGLVQIYTDIGYKSSYIFVLGSKDSVLKVKAKMNDNTIGPGYDWDAKTTISAMCNDFGFAGATYTAAIEGDVPESMKEIVVPEGATALALLPSQTADLSAIKVNQDFIDDVKVQIPNSFDGGMIDLTSYFTKTVEHNILSLQLKDTAKPAATDMTVSMPGNDIKITVQNPIPGLCYSIVAADSADGFVDEQGVEKMNLDESERMQVIPYYGSTPPAPLTFTYDPAKKVQYFKVRVSPSANYGK